MSRTASAPLWGIRAEFETLEHPETPDANAQMIIAQMMDNRRDIFRLLRIHKRKSAGHGSAGTLYVTLGAPGPCANGPHFIWY
jgi:hypothetical protein